MLAKFLDSIIMPIIYATFHKSARKCSKTAHDWSKMNVRPELFEWDGYGSRVTDTPLVY